MKVMSRIAWYSSGLCWSIDVKKSKLFSFDNFCSKQLICCKFSCWNGGDSWRFTELFCNCAAFSSLFKLFNECWYNWFDVGNCNCSCNTFIRIRSSIWIVPDELVLISLQLLIDLSIALLFAPLRITLLLALVSFFSLFWYVASLNRMSKFMCSNKDLL